MKEENIVSYTTEELIAMQERGEDRTDWARVNAKTDAEIAADTANDPAWDGIPEDWYKHAVFRPASPEWRQANQQSMTVWLDNDVAAFLQRSGDCEAWINAVLRRHMQGEAAQSAGAA